MSTFLGLIEEIPGISVDRFDDVNLNSSAFFLSHCHTDHMVGLNNTFFDHLQKSDKYLYCSAISKTFLEGKFGFSWARNIKKIDLHVSVIINYKNNDDSISSISVSCISAKHCPGSVMFLFEKSNKLILYTGDFRIHPDDFSKLKPLHFCENDKYFPKKFDKVYLDTTFLDVDFQYLPSREKSLQEICKVARYWLDKNPRNVVVLECSASFGSEFLFIGLSNSLKYRVHVNDCIFRDYSRIMELMCHITTDPLSTPIHACMGKMERSHLKCRPDIDIGNILTIIPSVQRWAGNNSTKISEWDRYRERTFNVCYSTHASYRELKAFIEYFQPKEIFPSVCPKESEYQINCLLRRIINQICEPKEKKIEETKVYKLKLPKNVNSAKASFKSEYLSEDEDYL